MQIQRSLVKNGGAITPPLVDEPASARSTLSDYIALTKPTIISLLLVVTLVPMFLALQSFTKSALNFLDDVRRFSCGRGR